MSNTLGKSDEPSALATGWELASSSDELVHDFDFGASAKGREVPRSAERSTAGNRARISPNDFGTDPVGNGGPPPASPAIRNRLPEVPGYEILGELGRGGMGVVYKARQLRLNRFVALKMILAGEHAGPDALQRLLTEAETIARLRHPNVVQVHAMGDCNGRPYVELELVEGGNLAARLDGTPWPPRDAARLLERLARAVAQAHSLGIVHRDLKPSNILITDEGEPKVTDFGLAKSLQRDSGLTQTESILGSPSYMSPEQADGRTREVGPGADIYALGATLYELLTGRPPFVSPSILATLQLVKSADPVPPGQLQPGVPRDLETICLKCLQKEPEKRYASAELLADDLVAFLDGAPIRARRTPWWERGLKWIRRRPSTAGLIGVSVTAVCAAAAGTAWYRADYAHRVEAAHQRVTSLQAQADHFVVLGEEALRRHDWAAARAQFASARALIQAEPRLAGTRETVDALLATSDQKLDEQRARDAARTKFAEFQRLYDEAVFYQSEYTGLEPDANLCAVRNAARLALTLFRANDADGEGFFLDPAHFDPAEIRAITASCYALTLILAEVTGQPIDKEDSWEQARAGLAMIDLAPRLQRPTSAFHLCRAALLDRAGATDEAEAERTLGQTADAASQTAVDAFLIGEQCYRRHDLAGAVKALQRALVLQPDHFWAQYLLAVCHLKSHRPAEAQASFLACQSRRPAFVWTYLLKGFAEGEMRDFDLAEADFQRAEELGLDEDGRYVLLVNRGVMRVRSGHHEAAAIDLDEAVALKPDGFQAYVNLAQALQNLGRMGAAVRALDEAIARVADKAMLFRARSQAYRAWSKPEEALADLDRAVALSGNSDPLLASDHLERGLILQQMGRYVDALAACDQALVVRPDRPDVHRLRGVVLVALKRYDEAIRSFDVCLAGGAASPALYEARGLALALRGAYSRAISDYTLALASGPATTSLHANRGWAYLFTGAPELALRDFHAALRLEPANAHALSGRALAHVQLRHPDEAVADAQASLRGDEADVRLIYNAARVFSQAAASRESNPSLRSAGWDAAGRERAEALRLLARAVELTPPDDRASFWSAVVRVDAAFDPLRRARRFAELDDRYRHHAATLSAPGGSER